MLFGKVTTPLFRRPLGAYATFKRLLNAAIVEEKFVQVDETAPTKRSMKFPGVWLRDNCPCAECFHKDTNSRKINWERTNAGVRAKAVAAVEKSKTVTVNWSDGHESTFDLAWLQERDFAPENRAHYIENVYRPAPQLWKKEQFSEVLRTYDYNQLFRNDGVLLSLLESLVKQGFAMVTNANNDRRVVRQLADNIGFIKRTTYGEVFEVKSKEDSTNYAYLMTPLPLHTDMPYYEYKAGINILHCFVQSDSSGGSNLLTDGFQIADTLRREYPQHYEVLVRTPVDWFDMGRDGFTAFHNIWRAPVICLDSDGNFTRINHNITKRDSHFTVPLDQVIPWYEAYDKFLELAYAQAVEFKTKPGEVFIFNNLRMLHGRTAYEDSPENKRHLVGTYVDWDLIYSKMRVLKKGHGPNMYELGKFE